MAPLQPDRSHTSEVLRSVTEESNQLPQTLKQNVQDAGRSLTLERTAQPKVLCANSVAKQTILQ